MKNKSKFRNSVGHKIENNNLLKTISVKKLIFFDGFIKLEEFVVFRVKEYDGNHYEDCKIEN